MNQLTKLNEEGDKEFDSLVFHYEENGWGGTEKTKCINAEHLGDVVSKLIPKMKDFIHQEREKAFIAGEQDTLEMERTRIAEAVGEAQDNILSAIDFCIEVDLEHSENLECVTRLKDKVKNSLSIIKQEK